MLTHKHLLPAGAFVLFIWAGIARAQTLTCADQLTWASDFAARNYAGFEDKVTPATRPAYDSLLATLRAEAARANTDGACDTLLRRWVAFFRDNHLSISRRTVAQAGSSLPAAPEPPESIRARFASWERRSLDESQARERLGARSGELDPVEGIWLSGDGNYRVAVLRDTTGGDFVMTILRADSVYWVPGQVKARFARDGNGYRARFFMRDHSEQPWTARVERNLLRFSTGSTWLREFPARTDDVSPLERRTVLDGRFAAYDLEPGTVLVRVPTFGDPKGIDSLFATEGQRIRSADRLIIDVRGNGGGSDYNFREFRPLLYTDPIRQAGADILATAENIESQLLMARDTTYPGPQRDQLMSTARWMEQNRGKWIRGSDNTRRESGVLEKPRVVAVLVDRGCASSCEQFLLEARQSAKVTLYGTNSGGVLDYGNVRSTQMPGSTLVLNRPITRSRRVPTEAIDNIGIPPGVPIPDDVLLQVPWVLRRRSYSRRRRAPHRFPPP